MLKTLEKKRKDIEQKIQRIQYDMDSARKDLETVNKLLKDYSDAGDGLSETEYETKYFNTTSRDYLVEVSKTYYELHKHKGNCVKISNVPIKTLPNCTRLNCEFGIHGHEEDEYLGEKADIGMSGGIKIKQTAVHELRKKGSSELHVIESHYSLWI